MINIPHAHRNETSNVLHNKDSIYHIQQWTLQTLFHNERGLIKCPKVNRDSKNVNLNFPCCLVACLLWGTFFCPLLLLDFPLQGSQFNTFLAALVSMIVICFHREHRLHNSVWNSRPCLIGFELQTVNLISPLDKPKRNRGWQLLYHPSAPHLNMHAPVISFHCHISRGISHTRQPDGTQSSVTAAKTAGPALRQITLLIQQRLTRVDVFVTLWGRLHKAESKCRIKCERGTETALKSMKRRRVVTPPRLAAHNDKGEEGRTCQEEQFTADSMRSAKVVCS